MVSSELWARLEIEPEDMEQRAAFFVAFAKTMEERRRPEVTDLIERSRAASSPRAGLEVFGDPPGVEEDDLRFDSDEVEESSHPSRPRWVRDAAIGDAYRQAAGAMLLLDAEQGRSLLLEAGRRYAHVTRPYGLFLVGLSETVPGPFALTAREMLTGSLSEQVESPWADTPITAPDQVYLMLAAAAARFAPGELELQDLVEMPIGVLTGRLRELPGAQSPAPFGTSDEPTATWWRLAADLLDLGAGDLQEGPVELRRSFRERLSRLALPQGESLERAQLDTYHWRAMQTQTELIDLDVVGTVCLINRNLGSEDSMTLEDFDDVPPLARLSLQVGVELSGLEGEGPATGSRQPSGAV
jgi:hypothetical protein